jgi:glycosyltransferase involved in cell wall biosynthesis
MASVESKSQQSPFREYIDILGFVSDEQKVDLLSSAELLVIPSKREGFPRVVAEAMASGLPVVTVDLPDNGTKDVVRHYGVGLVAKPDPASLARGVTAVSLRWNEYSRAGLAARDSLDWDVVLAEVLSLASRLNERS